MRKTENQRDLRLKKGVVVPPGFNNSFCLSTLLPLINMAYVRGFESKYGVNREKWPLVGKLEFAKFGQFKLPSFAQKHQEIHVEQNLFFWEKGKRFSLPIGMWVETEEHVILAFRGTLSAFEWYHDVLIKQVKVSGFEGKVHDGFQSFFKSLALSFPTDFDKNKSFVITGHSLGGALATLAAYSLKALNPEVYLFGSPRVGNDEFVRSFDERVDKVFRVENAFDLITELPPEELYVLKEKYRHVGKRVYVYASIDKLEDYKDLRNKDVLLGHFPSVYMKALKTLVIN